MENNYATFQHKERYLANEILSMFIDHNLTFGEAERVVSLLRQQLETHAQQTCITAVLGQ